VLSIVRIKENSDRIFQQELCWTIKIESLHDSKSPFTHTGINQPIAHYGGRHTAVSSG
jgi:hypothetical protein